MKRAALGCLMVLGLSLGGAAAAQAGEINGNGLPIPAPSRASSECAFSGRDLPDDQENQPNIPDDYVTGGHVATYGQYVRAGYKDVIPGPSELCRGNQ